MYELSASEQKNQDPVKRKRFGWNFGIDRIKLILYDSGNPTTKLSVLSCYEAFQSSISCDVNKFNKHTLGLRDKALRKGWYWR